MKYELPSFRYTHLFSPYENDRNGKSRRRDAPEVTSLAEPVGSLRLNAKDALVSYLPVLNWPVSKKEIVGVIFMLALRTLFLQRR